MNIIKNKLLTSLLIAFSFVFCTICPVWASGDSYLDTIYRAVEGGNDGNYSDDSPVSIYAGVSTATTDIATGGIIIDSDDPNPEVIIEDSSNDENSNNEELSNINSVLSDMTRILIGMNTGISIDTSSFTIIDLNDISDDPPADDPPADDPPADDPPADDPPADDPPADDPPADDPPADDPPADDPPADDPPADDPPADDPPADDPPADDPPADNPSADDPPADDPPADDPPADPFGDDTPVDNPENGDPTNTEPGTEEEQITALKASIQTKYGIKCTDGTNQFSLRQLQLIDSALDKLNKGNFAAKTFVRSTTEIVRDKEPPENFNSATVTEEDRANIAGYVIAGQTVVHLLDRATSMSEENIKELEEINHRKFSQAELIDYIEEKYVHTVIHEMTHAFQNDQKAKGNDIVAQWQERFWNSDTEIKTDGIAPSAYAMTAPYEDMAECIAFYITGNGIIDKNEDGVDVYRASDFGGTTMDIERYNFIKENFFDGLEFLDTAPTDGGLSI